MVCLVSSTCNRSRSRLFFFPSGAPKDVAQFELPGWRAEHVTPDIQPLVKRDLQRVVAVDVLRKSVDYAGAFRFKGPEEAIPDDENAGVVAVEIFVIRAVVDAVVRRRVQHPFQI